MPAKRKTETSKSSRQPAATKPKAAGKLSAAAKKPAGAANKAAGAANKPAAAAHKVTRTGNKPKAGAKAKVPAARPSLKAVVIDTLADMKALEVKVLDVRGLTDIADFMVIASGTSDRHVRSVAQRVVEKTKEAGFRPHGVEGQQDADWVLIDLNEMIVHVMLPRVREFYGLEKLWDMTLAKRAAARA